MSHKVRTAVRYTTKRLFNNITKNRLRKRVISRFANKIGLLYFGTVDQHSDDHKVVRGFTVSTSHKDNNYCVGSIGGYDTIIVDRSDATVTQPNRSIIIYNWLIISFDLHTKQDIPHFFLEANNKDSGAYKALFDIFPTLKEINLGIFETYGVDFTSRFSLNTKPSDSIQIERLFPANTARTIGTHFWPLSAEQHEGILYIYSDDLKITPNLMNKMFETGLWLAEHLDNQAELV